MPRLSNTLRNIRAAAFCVLALVAALGPGLGVTAFADASCRVECCDDHAHDDHDDHAQDVTLAKLEVDPCCPHHVVQKPQTPGDELAGHSELNVQVDVQVEAASVTSSPDSDKHSSDERCPDDCPSCHAGVGFALTMTPLLLPRVVCSTSEVSVVDAGQTPPATTTDGIYRPPRTLA